MRDQEDDSVDGDSTRHVTRAVAIPACILSGTNCREPSIKYHLNFAEIMQATCAFTRFKLPFTGTAREITRAKSEIMRAKLKKMSS